MRPRAGRHARTPHGSTEAPNVSVPTRLQIVEPEVLVAPEEAFPPELSAIRDEVHICTRTCHICNRTCNMCTGTVRAETETGSGKHGVSQAQPCTVALVTHAHTQTHTHTHPRITA